MYKIYKLVLVSVAEKNNLLIYETSCIEGFMYAKYNMGSYISKPLAEVILNRFNKDPDNSILYHIEEE
jgi:hypothetical protein